MKKNFSMPSLQAPDSGRSSTMQFRENPYGSLKYLEDKGEIKLPPISQEYCGSLLQFLDKDAFDVKFQKYAKVERGTRIYLQPGSLRRKLTKKHTNPEQRYITSNEIERLREMQENTTDSGRPKKFYQIEMHNKPIEALIYDPNPANKQNAAKKIIKECYQQIVQNLEEQSPTREKTEHTYDFYDMREQQTLDEFAALNQKMYHSVQKTLGDLKKNLQKISMGSKQIDGVIKQLGADFQKVKKEIGLTVPRRMKQSVQNVGKASHLTQMSNQSVGNTTLRKFLAGTTSIRSAVRNKNSGSMDLTREITSG